MIDIHGDWRLEKGTPVFRVGHDLQNKAVFTFGRLDGESRSYQSHGLVQGRVIVISWRSTLWLGHGSDESREIKTDRITGKPIEIHWHGGAPVWMTVNN